MTWKRVATALVLIPVVVGLVLFTPTWVVAIATAVVTVLALWEYFALGEAIGHRAYRVWSTVGTLLMLLAQTKVATTHSYFDLFTGFGSPLALALFVFVLGIAAATLWSKRPLVEALPAAGISCSGLFMVAFPLSFAIMLHGYREQGPQLLLFALVITWAGDTAAYFVGRAIGKHPLAPHISPKKTWEGSVGSMVGSLIVAWAFHYWIRIPIGHLVAMAVIGNVAGQMGDLLESAYKRSA
ncbi:MAG TPA: phosphatidate cytidylyltransferase, partial [Candidatus Acidoferrum sp.]|nr:phosphatidate cytidylyltransferase [Candidatus Acidoferrum sp.]